MKIPESIKIGGKTYKVEITDKLVFGSADHSAEIMYSDLIIRICPQAQAKMQADLMHELVHGIFDHLGYKDHDEKQIDELSNALYMVITDNPEIFK